MIPIILASESPRRRELIRYITDSFEVVPSGFDESSVTADPEKLPALLSHGKASDVCARFPGRCVVGADTVVILGDTVFGKPRDRSEAQYMLSKLSGSVHKVITGYTVLFNGYDITDSVVTDVVFRTLTDAEICDYVNSGEADGKAGAYAVQGKGALFVSEIHGDFYNVVGLPVASLAQTLRKIGAV